MTHIHMTRTRSSLIPSLAAGLAILALSAPALAGRGGSFAHIKAATRDGNPDGIVAALEQAENIPCTSECMNFVRGLLSSDSYYVRDGAAWWFARRPVQKVALEHDSVAALEASDSIAVRNAADTLGRVGRPEDITALGAAIQRRDVSPEARVAAVRAIGRIAHISADGPLSQAMNDPAPEVRREAVISWRHILRQQGAAPVAPLLTDSDVTVRRAAIATVGRFRVAAARATLENLVQSDDDPVVRRDAAWALGRIGQAASREALSAALDDESSLVRMTARAALRLLR